MKHPSPEVLEAISRIKANRQVDFDIFFKWLLDNYNEVNQIVHETPTDKNVFIHWVSLGNYQVLDKILDVMENTSDKIIQMKMRR